MFEVELAAKQWRTDPANRFFPTSGQLIGLIKKFDTPPPRLPRFVPYKDPVNPAKKTAAQILEEHGLSLPAPRVFPPLPFSTDKNGPVTDAVKNSRVGKQAVVIEHQTQIARDDGDF